VNALIVADQGFILTASANGFGKLTPLEEYPTHGRGGQGVIALQVTDRNGGMVGALQVSVDDEIMLMSQAGVLVRTPVKDISVVGRNTQGVRLIRLEEGDQLSGLERIDGLAAGADAADGEPSGETSGVPGADEPPDDLPPGTDKSSGGVAPDTDAPPDDPADGPPDEPADGPRDEPAVAQPDKPADVPPDEAGDPRDPAADET
jgi:hypothetical protein